MHPECHQAGLLDILALHRVPRVHRCRHIFHPRQANRQLIHLRVLITQLHHLEQHRQHILHQVLIIHQQATPMAQPALDLLLQRLILGRNQQVILLLQVDIHRHHQFIRQRQIIHPLQHLRFREEDPTHIPQTVLILQQVRTIHRTHPAIPQHHLRTPPQVLHILQLRRVIRLHHPRIRHRRPITRQIPLLIRQHHRTILHLRTIRRHLQHIHKLGASTRQHRRHILLHLRHMTEVRSIHRDHLNNHRQARNIHQLRRYIHQVHHNILQLINIVQLEAIIQLQVHVIHRICRFIHQAVPNILQQVKITHQLQETILQQARCIHRQFHLQQVTAQQVLLIHQVVQHMTKPTTKHFLYCKNKTYILSNYFGVCLNIF